MSKNQPVARIKDGSLSLAIFEDQAADGKARFSSPGVIRSYYDEAAKDWKETRYLSGTEFLRASMMLQEAYKQELELKVAAKNAANEASAPSASHG